MTDRVSDGLLAELERKINDGTPRGAEAALRSLLDVGAKVA